MSIYTSPICVCLVRALQGAILGLIGPFFIRIANRWSMPYERTIYCSMLQSACETSPVVISPLTTYLIEAHVYEGWPDIYYLTALLGLIIIPLCMFLLSSSPAEHAYISLHEQEKITKTQNEEEAPKKIPWRKILTCPAVLAYLTAAFCGSFIWSVAMTTLPQFYDNAVGMTLSKVYL